jgi:hypothetical protein
MTREAAGCVAMTISPASVVCVICMSRFWRLTRDWAQALFGARWESHASDANDAKDANNWSAGQLILRLHVEQQD